MLGMDITCYFGLDGNEFILNGNHQDVSAEEVYGPLTTPVFGSDVIYDCPNSKLMEQKKFVKFGLTQKSLEGHVPLIENEVIDYIKNAACFKGQSGTFDVTTVMSEVTLFTASRALQGPEVRSKLTSDFADVYHDLDNGFQPINFLMPWFPLPQNKRRDAAHIKMRNLYLGIIEKRRKQGNNEAPDMITNLMNCTYKNGQDVPDKEVAHMMITMLLGGQHSSASASAWILFRLAAKPEYAEELYQEQVNNLSQDGKLGPLQYRDLEKLPLLQNAIKETLRLHSSIHSIMRKVKRPMPVPSTPYVVTPGKVLLASPVVTALDDEFFPNAQEWNPHRWEGQQSKEDDDDDGDVTFSKGSRSPYLPFGAGRHRCIGEKFAYLNLSVIIATLVREFRFSTMDGSRTVPPTDYTSLFSRPSQPAIIRWTARDESR